MFTHLHENNKQKLNFNNSFERLKHSLFFLYKFSILVFALFAFSISQAQIIENTFNKKLENTIEKVASKVMENEKKIVINQKLSGGNRFHFGRWNILPWETFLW